MQVSTLYRLAVFSLVTAFTGDTHKQSAIVAVLNSRRPVFSLTIRPSPCRLGLNINSRAERSGSTLVRRRLPTAYSPRLAMSVTGKVFVPSQVSCVAIKTVSPLLPRRCSWSPAWINLANTTCVLGSINIWLSVSASWARSIRLNASLNGVPPSPGEVMA